MRTYVCAKLEVNIVPIKLSMLKKTLGNFWLDGLEPERGGRGASGGGAVYVNGNFVNPSVFLFFWVNALSYTLWWYITK